jgi:putative iron-dependent peroxidase
MFIGRPPGNTDRILDFSTAITGGLFFAPSADFLDNPPELPPASGAASVAGAGAGLGAAGQGAAGAQPAEAGPGDGSLGIGSLSSSGGQTSRTPRPDAR